MTHSHSAENDAHSHVWERRQTVTAKGHVLPAYEVCECGSTRPLHADNRCVRCWVEEGQDAPATMRVQHPRAGNTVPVCERHGGSLLANRWTRSAPADAEPCEDCEQGVVCDEHRPRRHNLLRQVQPQREGEHTMSNRLTPEVIAGLRRDNEEAKSKGWRAEVGVDDLDLLLDAVSEPTGGSDA